VANAQDFLIEDGICRRRPPVERGRGVTYQPGNTKNTVQKSAKILKITFENYTFDTKSKS
jgi:hypothetical protein